MKLVVIGGHSRNIGKTSLMCGIISATRDLGWTALKITQFGHGICSDSGHECGCSIDDPEHPYVISREEKASNKTDTSRFLQAGAREVFWVRTPVGQLGEAIPEIRRLIEGRGHVIIESNSIMRFLAPDLYLPVLQYDVEDFKLSSRLYLSRANAYVVSGSSRNVPPWTGIGPLDLAEKPRFEVGPPSYFSEDLRSFLIAALRQTADDGKGDVGVGSAGLLFS